MSLRRLSVQNLRNLSMVDIELSPRLNVFYGLNGSGKTSLLEAISILSLGRSFRSRKYKTLIQHDSDTYTVFGQIQTADREAIPVGVQRNRQGQVLIKRDGKQCSTAAELAESLPVLVMNGHSFGLLEGAPQVRRQFLDWLVFHVEHEFLSVWRSYEKCLKHRNSLLRRDKIDRLQLALWDRELAPLAARLDALRRSAYDRLKPEFEALVADFEGLQRVGLGYYRGWDKEMDFAELLESTQERDIELGYTRQGPHRADLRIRCDRTAAVDELSRGQQKVVVSALMIAQGKVFSSTQQQKQCVFLIDDLPAELDEQFRRTLAQWLGAMNCQVFVTGVERETLLNAWNEQDLETRVFHVEHGTVHHETSDQ